MKPLGLYDQAAFFIAAAPDGVSGEIFINCVNLHVLPVFSTDNQMSM